MTRKRFFPYACAALLCAVAAARPDGARGQSGAPPARTPLRGSAIQDDPRLDVPSQLWGDMYHELSIILGTPPRSHEKLEADFARFDRLLHRGVAEAREIEPCVEPLRQAAPHAYRAAELFSDPPARNKEAKIGGALLTQGAECMEKPRPAVVPTRGTGGGVPDGRSVSPVPPPSGGGNVPWRPPPDPPAPAPGSGPGSAPGPGPSRAPGADPCRPYGPGGYDYCNNPEGTRLPPGCVCRQPGIPPAAPTPSPLPCQNVPPIEEQTALRQSGIELLDTLAGGGQQTSLFLEHASRATLAGIAQMLHPFETVQGWGSDIAAAVDFLGNQDPGKWVALRDGAEAAMDHARRAPSSFLGDQVGAWVAGRVGVRLVAVKACRLDPNATRALSQKAQKTRRAAETATRMNKNANVPGNQPPCGINGRVDCFWRAMRDATGDSSFDAKINGPGVGSWQEVYDNLKKHFAGRVPGVTDPASHVEGIPSKRFFDDIMEQDLAQRGSEGLVFVRLQNGGNHVLMGANLTGAPGLFDGQKHLWGPGAGAMQLSRAFPSPPVIWRFYKTK